MARLEAQLGDITTMGDVDAIVNAGHEALLGGGGVDGAIHRAAGPGLLEECFLLPDCQPNGRLGRGHAVRCPTGEAKITSGHNLPAKFVIHTVAPSFVGFLSRGHYRAVHREVYDQLSACYRNCLRLADQSGIRSIAFPSLGTGAHSFPIELACPIALSTVRGEMERLPSIALVRFVCFSPEDLAVYRKFMNPA